MLPICNLVMEEAKIFFTVNVENQSKLSSLILASNIILGNYSFPFSSLIVVPKIQFPIK